MVSANLLITMGDPGYPIRACMEILSTEWLHAEKIFLNFYEEFRDQAKETHTNFIPSWKILYKNLRCKIFYTKVACDLENLAKLVTDMGNHTKIACNMQNHTKLSQSVGIVTKLAGNVETLQKNFLLQMKRAMQRKNSPQIM